MLRPEELAAKVAGSVGGWGGGENGVGFQGGAPHSPGTPHSKQLPAARLPAYLAIGRAAVATLARQTPPE